MDVLIPLGVLTGAVAALPPATGREAGPLAADDAALQAFLEDLARDRLLIRGPYPQLATEVRVPPPPRTVPFRRLLLLAAGIIASPAVAPAVRLALASAGPRTPHPFRRLALVAETLVPVVDPAAPLDDPARAEELARRVALAFGLAVEGESKDESAGRLAAVDARAAAQASRALEERRREGAIARAIAAAGARPAPLKLTPD